MTIRPGMVRLGLLLLAVAAGRAASQEPVAETEPERLPRYHVEVIVFAHNEGDRNEELFSHGRAKAREQARSSLARTTPRIVDGAFDPASAGDDAIVLDGLSLDELTWALREQDDDVASGDETPPAPLTPLTPETLVDDTTVLSPGLVEPIPDDLDRVVSYLATDRSGLRRFRFRLLEPDELQLGNAYNRISTLSAYEPLVHGGWVQEGLPEEQAYPFDLSYLGAVNPRGTIQLRLSRFLHVALNLEFDPLNTVTQGPGRFDSFLLDEIAVQPRYSLVGERRLRSGELHYIDHPLFGVLVLVTPEPEPEEEEGENAAELTPAA